MGLRSKRVGKYRSRFEAQVALRLGSEKVEFEYEKLRLKYSVVHTYTPDLSFPNGVIVELKGRFTPADRNKHLAIKKQHPELDIRFCFMNANTKINKKSKTTYGSWCDKHGFLWCEGFIPKEWYT